MSGPEPLSVDYWHRKEEERAKFEWGQGFLSGVCATCFVFAAILAILLVAGIIR